MRACIVGALLIAAMSCTSCGDVETSAPKKVDLSSLQQSPVEDVPLQEVVSTFVLGSKHTDVQRLRQSERLANSAVVWTFSVFDITMDGDRYKVTSELMTSTTDGSVGKFGVVAFVYVQKPSDRMILEKLRTGDAIKVKGVVQSINLRTALVLSPAVLWE